MAELSLICNNTSSSSGGSGGSVEVDRRILVRTGAEFPANTTLDINSPGAGWSLSGEEVTFANGTDFVENHQSYRNGQLLLSAVNNGATDLDVYFVAASGSLAFDFPIRTDDILQFWSFSTTASG